MHYKAYCIQDIQNFIEETILNKKDIMKNKREAFYEEYLLPPNGQSVGQNIYNTLKSLQQDSQVVISSQINK